MFEVLGFRFFLCDLKKYINDENATNMNHKLNI